MLQIIKEEFLNELNTQSPLSGSYYGIADVARIIKLFTDRVSAMEQPVTTYRIDEDTITRITEIAEVFATNHARNCADNYEFDEIEFNTDEYRGELKVTADVNVDSDNLSRSATFNATAAKSAFRELLTPNAQPNA